MLRSIDNQLRKIDDQADIVLLPEMFTTGFTMKAEEVAEEMDGPTIRWMQECAIKLDILIGGSLAIRDEDKIFNRFVMIGNEGLVTHYDKRHLFTLGQEDKYYSRGTNSGLFKYKGWKICLRICYDLRFPVWTSNTEDYDLFIRLAKAGMRAGRIDKKLIKQRKHPSSMCGSNWDNIKKDIDIMRNELVRDLGIEPKGYEKKLHIAFVEQNLSILYQYQFRDVLYWANKIIKANTINKVYSSTYLKEQLYIRLIRLIKRSKKKSLFDMIELRRSAEFYDKSISFRDLLYLYKSNSHL